MDITRACGSCASRHESFFCQLGPAALADLDLVRQACVSPAGATLFAEGEVQRGVLLLCAGRVKLQTTSPAGRTLILQVAGPGQALGLSAVMTDGIAVATAEALALTSYTFVERDDFLCLVRRHAEVALRVAEHLGVDVRRATRQAARIALASTARAKLAALLLDCLEEEGRQMPAFRFPLHLTQEEIGALIGCSRETVARLFTDLRRRELIRTNGRFVTIRDARQLEALLV